MCMCIADILLDMTMLLGAPSFFRENIERAKMIACIRNPHPVSNEGHCRYMEWILTHQNVLLGVLHYNVLKSILNLRKPKSNFIRGTIKL